MFYGLLLKNVPIFFFSDMEDDSEEEPKELEESEKED